MSAPRRRWHGPWRLDRSVGMWWRPFRKHFHHGSISLHTLDMVAFSLDGKLRWGFGARNDLLATQEIER